LFLIYNKIELIKKYEVILDEMEHEETQQDMLGEIRASMCPGDRKWILHEVYGGKGLLYGSLRH
jgi:hypothetical protein